MQSIDDMKGMILRDSHGFLNEEDLETLHVTIRIARDFNDFLEKFEDNPPPGEIVYISDTIRSGIDEFFTLAQTCGVVDIEDRRWRFDPHLHSDYHSLRREFLDRFKRLSQSSEADLIQRLFWLLTLVRLELTFLAQHYPFSIVKEISQSVR